MLTVFILCGALISPVLLEEVTNNNNNGTIQSNPEVNSTNVSFRSLLHHQLRDAAISNNQDSHLLLKTPFWPSGLVGAQRIPSICPDTDLLLKILQILTKSLPYTVEEPRKFINVLAYIKLLLKNAPNHPTYESLYNDFQVLIHELHKLQHKIGRIEVGMVPPKLEEQKLMAKILLRYDLPSKCKQVLSEIMDYLHSAYKQMYTNCLVSGKCLIDDFPRVELGIAGQDNPSVLDQLPQIHNPFSPIIKQVLYGENGLDVGNLLQNLRVDSRRPISGLDTISKLLSLQYGANINDHLPGILNGVGIVPSIAPSLMNPYQRYPSLSIKAKILKPDPNNLSWQNIYSSMQIPTSSKKLDTDRYRSLLPDLHTNENEENANLQTLKVPTTYDPLNEALEASNSVPYNTHPHLLSDVNNAYANVMPNP